jgi:hypothetical protein
MGTGEGVISLFQIKPSVVFQQEGAASSLRNEGH